MNTLVKISVIAALVPIFATNAQNITRQRNAPPVIILKNVNIVDVENRQVVEDMDIIIESGIIKEIGQGFAAVAENEKEFDMRGKYAVPGLIDAHVHLANSSTWEYQNGIDDMKYLLDRGVTSVRDVGGDARLLSVWKRAVDIKKIEGPDIFYSAFLATRDYYGNPSHDKAMMGGMKEEFCAWAQLVNPGDDLDAVMSAAKTIGATGVKIYLGYDKDFTRLLVEAARRHGLEPWSHAMLFPAKPSEIAQAGVKVLSHAYMFEWENVADRGSNVREAYEHRKEIDYGNIDVSEYIKYALENDAILDATLYISSQNGMDKYIYDIVRKIHGGGAKVAAGTDWIIMRDHVFPPLYDEIDLLVNECGFSNMEALRSATIIAAQTFAGEARKGSIKDGKDADIVILSGNPVADIANLKTIEFVIKDGRFVDRKTEQTQ